MIGTWRWNVGFGLFGALLTFLFSVSSNTIVTTIIRSFYAFVTFAALALALRFVLGVLLRPQAVPHAPAEEEKGSLFDLSTPDDESELADLLKEQRADGKDQAVSGFQPLNPAKLVSLDHPRTEEVVQAVRRMTDE
jgi:hypothetical protein